MRKTYRAVMKKYGADHQINKLHEEMAELTVAISHYREGRDSVFHIAEEIADVRHLLEQMEYLFDCEEVAELWLNYKKKRLKELLED